MQPQNLCDIEQVTRIDVTKEDELSQKLDIQLKDPDKEVSIKYMYLHLTKKCIYRSNVFKVRTDIFTLDAFYHQIKSFIKFCLAFVFGLQTYYLIHFSKMYQNVSIKGTLMREPSNNL